MSSGEAVVTGEGVSSGEAAVTGVGVASDEAVVTGVGVASDEAVVTGVGVASGKNVDLETKAAVCPGPESVAGVALVPLQAAKAIRLAKIKNRAKIIFFGVIEGFDANFIPAPRMTSVCNQGKVWL